MVPAVPPGVAFSALTMKLAPARCRMKNNRIAHVKRASLAERGKAGAVNTFCALLHRVTYMQCLLRTQRYLEIFQDHFITICIQMF